MAFALASWRADRKLDEHDSVAALLLLTRTGSRS